MGHPTTTTQVSSSTCDSYFESSERLRIQSSLRSSVQECSKRGLKIAAKFAAELLCSLKINPTTTSSSNQHSTPLDNESDTYYLAKTYFDCGEYKRASHTLKKDSTHNNNSSNASFFLMHYCTYLDLERTQRQLAAEKKDTKVIYSEWLSLYNTVAKHYEEASFDGFNLYLFGIILKQVGRCRTVDDKSCNEESFIYNAKDILLQSIVKHPYNYSAWVDLASCLDCPREDITSLFEPKDDSMMMMLDIFTAHVCIEQQRNEQALELLSKLSLLFPNCPYLIGQIGLAQYNLRDFDQAQVEFESLLNVDPYTLNHMDVYSNVLYVKEAKASLSRLAHEVTTLNKYSPQSCVVVGNYYSLKAKHDRAVLYFMRALKLDPTCLAAWTLIGHEYVELKNVPAAIEAYRAAVDISPSDYRAWYGLGQTYEILQMEFYALFYFQKAAALRPFDARMWCAMAGCFKRLDRNTDAIAAYERAIANNDREGIAAINLARLYRDLGNTASAATYFTLHLSQKRNSSSSSTAGNEGPETVDAILFMAHYYKDEGYLAEASALCQRLVDRPGPEKEEAKAILRELRSISKTSSS